jgi:hypothetical protein
MDAVSDQYRKRRQRKKQEMTDHAIGLLKISCWFVSQIDSLLIKRKPAEEDK